VSSFPFAAVLFDLDDTLLQDEAVGREAAFVTALEQTGSEASAVSLAKAAEEEARAAWQALPQPALHYVHRIGHGAIEGLWATYDPSIPAEAQLQQETARLRPEVWNRALQRCELKGDGAALERRWRHLRASFPLFPETNTVLALLRPKTKLGIVTNGVKGLQRAKLNGSGLLHWFDPQGVAVSGEVDIGKPERGIFDWVCERLGVAPKDCLMVGDNPERDVQGGINAGMKTCWVDRGFRARGVRADYEVKDLRELLQRL